MADSKEWKIYTRQGDQGNTRLIGGSLVPKYHHRIECYGTLDELNSIVGMLRDLPECTSYHRELIHIQQCLFSLESQLAADSEAASQGLPCLTEEDTLILERSIDTMNASLPTLSQFILPGGHPAVSWAHIARTVCRRAERLIVALNEKEPVAEVNLKYINRLSDYFFVLARQLTQNVNALEIPWNPKDSPK